MEDTNLLQIKSSIKTYKVDFYEDLEFINKLKEVENSFFIIDRKVFTLYRDNAFSSFDEGNLILLDAKEEDKTIDTALKICEKMTTLSSKRNTTIVSIGGGIVQDITGFVADILYRGVKWIFVPTTLLAACDSCIGGKTSLNYKSYKNLLGTFFPPDRIYICPLFFRTLTTKDFKSGLGEVVKFNIMYGSEGIKKIENDIDRLISMDDDCIKEYVKRSLEFKKSFIEIDEFDRNERIKLNFAHTFGHAIESITHYLIPHGTAVAMGTIVANYISLNRKWLEKTTFDRINNLIKKIVDVDYGEVKIEKQGIINAIRKDKKQIDKGIRAVLMKEDSTLVIVDDVEEEEIFRGFTYMKNFLFEAE